MVNSMVPLAEHDSWVPQLIRSPPMLTSCTCCCLPCLPAQPGDCVIINAANSIVGRTLVQLCKLLKLRCVAVLRCRPRGAAGGSTDSSDARFAATAEQLQALGANLVLKDEGSIKVCLIQPESHLQYHITQSGGLLLRPDWWQTLRQADSAWPSQMNHPPALHCMLLPALQMQLASERFFGKPKLALDAVGGDSAARLADALEQVRW